MVNSILSESFNPLAEKNLIVGYLTGNHESRVNKELGIDISKIICKELKIPYLGYAGWSLFYVGNQSYSLYSTHGASSATLKHTKLKSILDLSILSSFPVINTPLSS